MTEQATPAFLLARDLSRSVGERRLAEPEPADVMIKVHWSGLCGSDLHVMRTGEWVTAWPATLGHELYGTVEVAGTESGFAPGEAVVADSRIPCGRCSQCYAGDFDRCSHFSFVGEARPGAFAGHCVLPARMVHRVPPELESPVAVLSEPLAVALHAISLLRSGPRRVAIFGHGCMGALMHIEMLRRYPSASFTIAEPIPLRAKLASAFGAEVVASSSALRPGSFDTVVDAAGHSEAMPDALAAVAARGQVLSLALSRGSATIRPADFVERGLALFGCNAFEEELPDAIALLAEQSWRYEPVISDAVSLDELPALLSRQLERTDAVKVLVCP